MNDGSAVCHRIAATLFLLCFYFTGFTQETNTPVAQDTTLLPVDSAKLIVVNIEVTGKRKTKKYIIEREMRFKTGDTIPAAQVYQKLEESRQLIYNTNLFADVSLVPAFVSGEDK